MTRARRVVLGAALTVLREEAFVKEDLNPPIRPIRDGAAGFGFVNFPNDVDAFVRRAPLTRSYQGAETPGSTCTSTGWPPRPGCPPQPCPGSAR